jgi:hypothetical protein
MSTDKSHGFRKAIVSTLRPWMIFALLMITSSLLVPQVVVRLLVNPQQMPMLLMWNWRPLLSLTVIFHQSSSLFISALLF